MSIDWSKAPEGCIGAFARIIGNQRTAFFVFSKRPSDYMSREGYKGEGEDGSYHVFSEFWEWLDKPWDGQGLPPVGIEAEVIWDSTDVAYYRVKILAHDEGRVVFRWCEGESKGQYGSYDVLNFGILPTFRPIRPPEQIAAEEREKAINQMISDAGYVDPKIGTFVAMGNLYDAGYRRQESST
ncbi:hypothetical protein ACEOIB_24970 [Pseudomonas aeruginosa]|nr:hypothetical protein [Pseudomonas aeruginosa]HEQ0048620.1 hypothetical protein [Pseudomonas aeruginosa]